MFCKGRLLVSETDREISHVCVDLFGREEVGEGRARESETVGEMCWC